METPKKANSVETMLFGIILVLFGGFILVNPSSDLGGLEFFIMLAGVVTGIIGLRQAGT